MLDAAIAALLTAADGADLSPRMRLRCRNKLASGYWQRFDVTRDPPDLDHALALNEFVMADTENAKGRDLAEAQMLRACFSLSGSASPAPPRTSPG